MYGHAEEFVASINSYLGLMRHFASYRLRERIVARIDMRWWKVVHAAAGLEKLIVKKPYKKLTRKRREIRRAVAAYRKSYATDTAI